MCKGLGLCASKRQTSEFVKDLKLSRQRDAVSKSALLKLASLMTFFYFCIFNAPHRNFSYFFSGVATQSPRCEKIPFQPEYEACCNA